MEFRPGEVAKMRSSRQKTKAASRGHAALVRGLIFALVLGGCVITTEIRLRAQAAPDLSPRYLPDMHRFHPGADPKAFFNTYYS